MGLIPAMRSIYQIGFFAGIFVAFLRRATLKETMDPSKMEKVDWSNIPKLWKDSYLSFWETVKWLPSPLMALAVIQVIQIFFNSIAGSMWIVYATAIIGITATQWGLTAGIEGLTRLSIAFNAGKLMDKYGRRKFLIPAMCVIPFIPLIFISVSNWEGLAAMVILMAIMNAFLVSGFQSLLSDWCPRDKRGRVTSTIGSGSFVMNIRATTGNGGMLTLIPAAIGQALGGTMYMQNPSLPFLVTSVGMVIVVVWAYFKLKDPRVIEK
jgi:MFS family permease